MPCTPSNECQPREIFFAPLSAPKRLISAETTRRDPRQSKNRQIIIDTGEIPNARERGDFCTYYHCIISNLSAGKFIYRARAALISFPAGAPDPVKARRRRFTWP